LGAIILYAPAGFGNNYFLCEKLNFHQGNEAIEPNIEKSLSRLRNRWQLTN